MAIVVEDGTARADAESYASVAEATAYATKLGNTAWGAAATDALREAALRRATRYLDGRYHGRWPGYRRTSAQRLDWPRTDAVDSSDWPIPSSGALAVPAALKDACCEAALLELASPGVLAPQAQGSVAAKTVQAGPVSTSTTYAGSAPLRATVTALDDLLANILSSAVARDLLRA